MKRSEKRITALEDRAMEIIQPKKSMRKIIYMK